MLEFQYLIVGAGGLRSRLEKYFVRARLELVIKKRASSGTIRLILRDEERIYIAIDLKSFYASVECVERGLDPLSTNLVVADSSRTDKTICLAVSPSLKAYGISGRARLFEVVQRVRQVNWERSLNAPWQRLTGKSVYDAELKQNPSLAVDYLVAPPRMAHYIEYSTRIYEIYLKYVAPEDIHVYSIDEVFMDVTQYLAIYKKSPHDLAMTIVRDVLAQTGITATAGIGTNMYLCKVAMDIVAKHLPVDKDGVRIAQIDELAYRQQLWNHKPLTDFWRVGRGIASRLQQYGIDTMGKIARVSLRNPEFLYRLFGVNAELLIDHAWGWEPCTIDYVKAYRPETNCLSSGQVLTRAYTVSEARIVIQEMADAVALDLVDKRLVTDQLVVTIGYDIESLTRPEIASQYHGEVSVDYYGRRVPKHSHGTFNLDRQTSSARLIGEGVLALYDRITNPNLLVRRLNITVNHVVREELARNTHRAIEYNLFTDIEKVQTEVREENETLSRERAMQETLLELKKKYGKNAILKGLNFAESATARDRNAQIGGHKA